MAEPTLDDPGFERANAVHEAARRLRVTADAPGAASPQARADVHTVLDALDQARERAVDAENHAETMRIRADARTEERDTARADLDELRTRNTLLQNTATNMLNAFVHPTYPGTPCMQSRHVDLAEIGRWRAIVWPTPQRILEK